MTTTTTHPHDRPSADSAAPATADAPAVPVLEIVFVAHDREPDLETCVRLLHRHLGRQLPLTWQLTILDQASTDATWPIACRLARELPGVRAARLASPGGNTALHAAWSASTATILVVADVDARTDLAALHPLVAPLLSGHSDVAVGRPDRRRGHTRPLLHRSRRAGGERGELLAIRFDRVGDGRGPAMSTDWDRLEAALLTDGARGGLRTYQLPVDRLGEPDHASRPRGAQPALVLQAARFAVIGVASTLAYVGLYLALRPGVGAFAANATALAATAVANTAANRRLTFGIHQRSGALRHQVQGLMVFAVALGVTTASLAGLDAADAHPGRLLEATVLVAANLTATVLRFVLLRRWVFRPAAGT